MRRLLVNFDVISQRVTCFIPALLGHALAYFNKSIKRNGIECTFSQHKNLIFAKIFPEGPFQRDISLLKTTTCRDGLKVLLRHHFVCTQMFWWTILKYTKNKTSLIE